jgi:uncharacterized protein YecE (DUF72 family)
MRDAGGLTASDRGRVRAVGRVFAGTSGFAYPGWAPRFYPAGTPADALLATYATRLDACELSTTYYARPKPERIGVWAANVPASFRFIVKAQRGASVRALATDPSGGSARLTEHLERFGERLGGVLFRISEGTARRDDRLLALLTAWPRSVPLVVEAQDPAWHVDETFSALRDAGAVLCTTDRDEDEGLPDIRRTGPFLYLRLRRTEYDEAALDAWAARLVPFIEDGMDAYVMFRHDEHGATALQAEGFAARVERILARS